MSQTYKELSVLLGLHSWRAHMMEGPNFLGEFHNPLAFWRPSEVRGSEKLPKQQLKKYSVCSACKQSPTIIACALWKVPLPFGV